MKLIKFVAYLLLAISFSIGATSTAFADKKDAQKKQKQVIEKAQKDAVKKVKKQIMPELDKAIAAKEQAIKQEKNVRKANKKEYKDKFSEQEKNRATELSAKNKLVKLQDKAERARNEIELVTDPNVKAKKQKVVDGLDAQVEAAQKAYEDSPLKKYNDSVAQTNALRAKIVKNNENLDNLNLEDIKLKADKILALRDAKQLTDAKDITSITVYDKLLPHNKYSRNVREPFATKVFDQPLFKRFNVADNPPAKHDAGAENVLDRFKKPVIVLKDDLRDKGLGKRITNGGVSTVYADKDPKWVNKVVRLTNNKGQYNPIGEKAINDQKAGRAILNKVKQDYEGTELAKLFSVAKTDGSPEILTAKVGAIEHKFIKTRDENISSDEVDETGKVLGKVTNAYDRIQLRKANGSKEEGLNEMEELTINIVIRALNQNGIAWTDHKLENLDVVKDPNSPTGYKAVFFDFDAFRPVKGDTRKERYREARQIQKTFDNMEVDLRDNVEVSKMWDKVEKLHQEKFDFTAFGGSAHDPGPLLSPNINKLRTAYKNFDGQPAAKLNATTKKLFKTTDETLDFEPEI